ncbi:YncE family protein [Fodinibius sediminis]|uniref:40-residue YVTN family beta-propeller repeat-containing protein n=1 Tax=Fodinibius sediminis TaxID=1214077 RepID=A0A521B8S5_9BACT|nr:DUF5074 domain-containing protein [Fodinibius sediminis]SMO43120.1 40-residue YVTN family beta-propeller repeat-containing protein [Fodinibius sediminis]
MNVRYVLFFLLSASIFTSCLGDTGNNPDPLELATVYVSNEGNFSDASGSITSYDPESGSSLQSAFEEANGRPLAGIIQSVKIRGERLYIVLNEANKIEVTEVGTLESIGTIEMSTTPTDFELINEEVGYVSNLYDGSVTVVNVQDFEETDTAIAVGSQPRSMVRLGNMVYVANSGSGSANTITVVNASSDTVMDTIEVGAGPAEIALDVSNRLWVVCSGKIAYDENWERDPANDVPGSVYILDGGSATVIDSIQTGGHPSDIALNNEGAEAYLIDEAVSVVDMNTYEVKEARFIDRTFSSIEYMPTEGRIYVGDSRGYSQNGQALIYELSGTAVDSFTVGIAPRIFHFIVN